MEEQGLLAEVEGFRNDAIELMCGMISVPSLAPSVGGQGESARADYLQSHLTDFDEVRRFDLSDPDFPGIKRSSLLAKKHGPRPGTVWVIAHIDTVPAGDLSAWQTNPFKGVYKDGKIYGRGTEDNGQSVISSITAARTVRKGTLKGMSMGLALVADEEQASEEGIVALIKQGCFDQHDVFLVPDWGSPAGSLIEIDEKSLIWLQFDVIGKTAHGSTPEKGLNALTVAAQLIGELKVAFPRKFGREDPGFRSPCSTFEPTKADATVPNVNSLPGKFTFAMDIRVLPSYKVDDVRRTAERVSAAVAAVTGAKIVITELQRHVAGRRSATDTPVYRTLSDAVTTVTGHRPEAVGVGGATCANFFRAKGLDAYVWQCGGGTLHAPNEHVVVDNLITDAKVFALVFDRLCVKGV
ncbi:MAG: M20 family metallo-hydrolase [Candidatus Methanomethylophilus sp.]|nr:M20 family metallo-hydrolase [Methanomethylophilus sp.]